MLFYRVITVLKKKRKEQTLCGVTCTSQCVQYWISSTVSACACALVTRHLVWPHHLGFLLSCITVSLNPPNQILSGLNPFIGSVALSTKTINNFQRQVADLISPPCKTSKHIFSHYSFPTIAKTHFLRLSKLFCQTCQHNIPIVNQHSPKNPDSSCKINRFKTLVCAWKKPLQKKKTPLIVHYTEKWKTVFCVEVCLSTVSDYISVHFKPSLYWICQQVWSCDLLCLSHDICAVIVCHYPSRAHQSVF